MAESKPKNILFDDDEQEESKKIRINKTFATKYQQRKQKEELHSVRFNVADDDSSSGSSEDEDGRLLTKSMDVNILKTINALRSKEKRIYDPEIRFFEQKKESDYDSSDEETPKEKQKVKRYKDVVREQILEQMEDGEAKDDGNDDHIRDYDDGENRSSRFAYDAEQKEIRKAFLSSTKDKAASNESEVDSEDDLMVVKNKDRNDDDSDNEEAQKQLEEEIVKMKAAGGDRKLVDPRGEVQDGDKFILDFFKNQTWVDKEGTDDEASDDDSDDGSKSGPGDEESLEDLDAADDYESQYNFRFEQAASDIKSGAELSIKSYARGQTMNTLRRKDETRRDKRLARKDRKAAERKAKEEQLRRLKNAKRQEMEEKISKVKAVLGDVGEDGGDAVDEATLLKLLEGDFDPEKFEALMKETYGDDFYEKQDTEWKNDQDVRASLKGDEGGAEIVGQDEAGGLYDDSHEPEDEEEGAYNEEEDEWMEEEGGYFEEDAEEETAIERKVKGKMMEELYKLDYEDIVAGMPTRFKYRQVEPNNYGLSTKEILFAPDAALKQFVSLNKMAPYREDGEHFVGSRKRRRFRDTFKHELEEQAQKAEKQFAEEAVDEPVAEESNKKKRRRKRGKKKGDDEESSEKAEEPASTKETATENTEDAEPTKSKRRRRKKSSGEKSEQEAPTQAQADESALVSKTVVVDKSLNEAKEKKPKKDKSKKKKKSQPESPTQTKLDESVPPSKSVVVDKSLNEAKEKKPKKDKSKKKKKSQPESPTQTKLDEPVPPSKAVVVDEPLNGAKEKKPKKDKSKKKKKKEKTIGGVSESRFASYGL